jgi:hypothetical protein
MSSSSLEFNTLDAACQAWQALLGADAVLRAADVLQRYGRTTLPQAPAPVAILCPTDPAQVLPILKVAATRRIPLYPISRGKDWGWGNACPTTPGQVILDLSALDRILEINEELGYAVIQPGVTQGQLVDELARTHSNLHPQGDVEFDDILRVYNQGENHDCFRKCNQVLLCLRGPRRLGGLSSVRSRRRNVYRPK